MKPFRMLTVVGARPQLVKAAAISRALAGRDDVEEVLLHTGQHFDPEMSRIFFDELGIATPKVDLGIHGGGHGAMTGRMLAGIEAVILSECPDLVLVSGDTNSTLSGALAAAKLNVPVAHLEAGLRSFNRAMPEEINRVLTDHASALLLCPTETAIANLRREGIVDGVHDIGDVMYDAALFAADRARGSQVVERLGLAGRPYAVATVHRAESTGDPDRLAEIIGFLGERARHCAMVLPLHPRTRAQIARWQARSRPDRHLRAARLSRYAPPPAIGGRRLHRFRRAAEGGLFSPRAVRHAAQRNRMGRDRERGMEPPVEGARLSAAP